MSTYTITNFDTTTGNITVNDSGIDYVIVLSIVDGKYPEGEELDTYIKGFLPSTWVNARSDIIASGVANEEVIAALVTVPEITTSTATPVDPTAVALTSLEAEIISILLKYNVITTDPTIV